MAFLVYEISKAKLGMDFRNPEPLKVNILAAILIDYLRRGNVKKSQIFTWHINQNEILTNLEFDPQKHAFVIDVKPDVKNNVSICKLQDIWGYSNDWWTPVLIRLESIFIDKKSIDHSTFKRAFNDSEAEREVLHEILYLDAGTHYGKRRWGKTGYVNAALLWPEVLSHFCSIIEENPF